MNRLRRIRVAVVGLLPILLLGADKAQPDQIKWAERVERVKPGMRREQVQELLPQRYWGGREYEKEGIVETYWVDDEWVVVLFYQYDNIRDRDGKIVPNVGNNRLGKVLSLEQRKHPVGQIPKSEWTHARALELVLALRREEIKTLENALPEIFVPKLEWGVTHVPSYGGAVVPHRFVVELEIGGRKKATWDVDLYTANVSPRAEEKEDRSNNRTHSEKQ